MIELEKKLLSIEEISEIINPLKNIGKIIVTTSGSFDILHSAHVHFLQKAKKEGDVLIVLLNTDSSIKRNKGEKRPIVPEDERAKMLVSLECVDYVVIFNEDKPLKLLEMIKPNIHVKGGSFIPERIKEEKELLDSWEGKYKTFELEEGYSTTNIIQTILEKYNNI
ncbi:adenylyltransferase/cytidyltransferase family protein [Candidatus Pacearchaeota archaeon]|nr:adenylyltransferase/cytidyltransferase family protein [Candidatus Pacearchaeota archaeon]